MYKCRSTKEFVIGFTLIFESKTTVRHVVQVLEPFKVRDGHTTGVDVQVWNDKNVALNQNFVGGRSSGSVGSLGNDLEVDNKYQINFKLERH